MPLCTPKDILHNTCVTVSRTDAQWEKLYNIQALHCVLRHCYKTQCYVIGKRNEPAGLHKLWCVASGDDCLLLLYWVPDTVFCLSLINFISLNAKFFQQARVFKKKKKKHCQILLLWENTECFQVIFSLWDGKTDLGKTFLTYVMGKKMNCHKKMFFLTMSCPIVTVVDLFHGSVASSIG